MPRFPALEAAGPAPRAAPHAAAVHARRARRSRRRSSTGASPRRSTSSSSTCPGLFDRAGVYGERGEDYPDNALRFAVLSRAAAELVRQRAAAGARSTSCTATTGPRRSCPTYLRALAAETPALAATRTVLTIHNVAHQGVFPKDALPSLGLGWDALPRRRHRVLRRHQPAQAGHRHGRRGDDREPHVRARDPDARARREARRRAARRAATRSSASSTASTTRCGTRRPTPRSPPATTPRTSPNKARCKGALQKELGLPIDAARAARRERRAHGRAEGDRPRRRGAAEAPARRPTRRSSSRATATPALVAAIEDAVAKVARARGVRARGERGARAPHLRRGRPRPRAEPVRAVRPRADVRAALRRAAGRARDGRARRHHRRLRREARDGHRVPLRRRRPPTRSSARPSGPSPRATLPRWPALVRRVMRLDRGWERPARRYEQLYRVARGAQLSSAHARTRRSAASTARSARASHDARSATRATTTAGAARRGTPGRRRRARRASRRRAPAAATGAIDASARHAHDHQSDTGASRKVARAERDGRAAPFTLKRTTRGAREVVHHADGRRDRQERRRRTTALELLRPRLAQPRVRPALDHAPEERARRRRRAPCSERRPARAGATHRREDAQRPARRCERGPATFRSRVA